MKIWLSLGLLLTFLFSSYSYANETYHSSYVGEESRKIKSLSQDDIMALQKGAGWGMAKAAELNGYPGPKHIIQMQDEINLTLLQKSKINLEFQKMQTKAMALGNELILLEEKLNNAFSNKSINEIKLDEYITDIMDVRARLRLVHLSTHLKTPSILTQEQVILYNDLRGYSTVEYKNPCTFVPEGHDAKMWRKHNGCK